MNQTEQILLKTIQKSLWNTDVSFPDDTDWDAVLREASAQAVLGIVIDVAPEAVQQKWKPFASAGTAHFVRILHYQEQLYTLLKEHDVPMVILKGTAAAIYYPKPAQRSMGDIDFLVPQESFDRAKTLLADHGYTIEDDPRYLRHIAVRKDQLSFEMHRFFNDNGFDVDQFILSDISNATVACVLGRHFPILPQVSNGLVLLGHMAGHMQTGLGLRQVIDWVLFVNQELDDALWESKFQAAAKQSGLETLAITVTKMCREYLGLKKEITWCNQADSATVDMLIHCLLSSGNFGYKQGKGRSVSNTVTKLKAKGFFRYLQKAGEFNWKAYHKHKWLKPFCWIYQIGRYVRQGVMTKRNRKQVLDDVERGKQRAELLEKLGLK